MLQSQLESLLRPTVESMGYILWAVEYLPQGKHSLLRIYIDSDNGITLEDCERVSHQISGVLDVEDPITGEYNLEVSSPGIPRPLFSLWHFTKFIGEEVTIKVYRPVLGKRKIKGIIKAVEDDNITLTTEGNDEIIPITNVVKANLTV